MDRQTVYDLCCHENILSRTNKMQFTDREKFFTDRETREREKWNLIGGSLNPTNTLPVKNHPPQEKKILREF